MQFGPGQQRNAGRDVAPNVLHLSPAVPPAIRSRQVATSGDPLPLWDGNHNRRGSGESDLASTINIIVKPGIRISVEGGETGEGGARDTSITEP